MTQVGQGVQPPSQRNVPAAHLFCKSMHENLQAAKKALAAARDRQKRYADEKRRDVEFSVGDQVLLSTKNIRLKYVGATKLMPRWIGPFTVSSRINEVAYRLDLPDNMKIHNVFHVSLLQPYRDDGRVQPPPPAVFVDGEPEYEVQSIIDHRDVRSGRGRTQMREYLIKWLGYGPEHNTWEPDKNLANCPAKLSEYLAELRNTNRPATRSTRVIQPREVRGAVRAKRPRSHG